MSVVKFWGQHTFDEVKLLSGGTLADYITLHKDQPRSVTLNQQLLPKQEPFGPRSCSVVVNDIHGPHVCVDVTYRLNCITPILPPQHHLPRLYYINCIPLTGTPGRRATTNVQ